MVTLTVILTPFPVIGCLGDGITNLFGDSFLAKANVVPILPLLHLGYMTLFLSGLKLGSMVEAAGVG